MQNRCDSLPSKRDSEPVLGHYIKKKERGTQLKLNALSVDDEELISILPEENFKKLHETFTV